MTRTKTIDIIKQHRTVPVHAKEIQKEYNKARRIITEALKSGPKSVPELAKEIALEQSKTMYYVMCMLKFGLIEKDELDDMDEYFSYKLKRNE